MNKNTIAYPNIVTDNELLTRKKLNRLSDLKKVIIKDNADLKKAQFYLSNIYPILFEMFCFMIEFDDFKKELQRQEKEEKTNSYYRIVFKSRDMLMKCALSDDKYIQSELSDYLFDELRKVQKENRKIMLKLSETKDSIRVIEDSPIRVSGIVKEFSKKTLTGRVEGLTIEFYKPLFRDVVLNKHNFMILPIFFTVKFLHFYKGFINQISQNQQPQEMSYGDLNEVYMGVKTIKYIKRLYDTYKEPPKILQINALDFWQSMGEDFTTVVNGKDYLRYADELTDRFKTLVSLCNQFIFTEHYNFFSVGHEFIQISKASKKIYWLKLTGRAKICKETKQVKLLNYMVESAINFR